jgi:hypothetical protein
MEQLAQSDKDDLAKQLSRAKEEHEEDQKERRLSKAGEGKVGEGGASMATLKRVEEMVQVLKRPVEGGPVGLGGALPSSKTGAVDDEVASVCKELAGLLEDSEPCRVYLRQCGGVAALVKVVKGGSDGAMVVREAVGALMVACLNERNTKEGVKHGLYPALVVRLSSEDDELASSAALLLGNCAVEVEQRREISRVLSSDVGDGTQMMGLSHLLRMLRPGKPPSVAASALMVLQNCAVDKPSRAAFQRLQGDRDAVPDTPLGDISALLASSSTRFGRRRTHFLLPYQHLTTTYGAFTLTLCVSMTKSELADTDGTFLSTGILSSKSGLLLSWVTF